MVEVNLKTACYEELTKLDRIIETFSSFRINGQQPIFLKEIVIRLTDAKLWIINGATMLEAFQEESKAKKTQVPKKEN